MGFVVSGLGHKAYYSRVVLPVSSTAFLIATTLLGNSQVLGIGSPGEISGWSVLPGVLRR